ncbi:unnamed protein product [Arctia plantaginis]|uniref:Uncharacterized protein n=1 Tax=Arctia plantaginis TaxID=874455 RepID=A0A8S1BEH6_ARCPL|nr:unnamed protein product [Arctia plantaginis]CAB3238329.1 unnamed protein product [Arctia plantaginis]CAB3256957.1 unnamed protein product [Arctia plantaginis]
MSFPYKLDVEPGLKRASLYSRSTTSSRHTASTSGKTKSIIVPRESRTNPSYIINKEKVLSSTIKPRHNIDNNKNTKELESEEPERSNKFIEIGVNTHISGSLQCKHNFLPHVRKRNVCDCKYSFHDDKRRGNCKMRAKEIQAIIPKRYFSSDKACSQWIKTSNCGTQFFEQILSPLKTMLDAYVITDNFTTPTCGANNIEQVSVENDKMLSDSKVEAVLTSPSMDKKTSMSGTYSDIVEACLSPIGFNNISPRRKSPTRWAISPYSVPGPDF